MIGENKEGEEKWARKQNENESMMQEIRQEVSVIRVNNSGRVKCEKYRTRRV